MQFEAYARIARHAGLRQPELFVSAFSSLGGPADEIAGTLRHHHLMGVVRSMIDEENLRGRLDPGLIGAIETQRPVQPVTAETLLQGFEEVRGALDAGGIPVVLLKGLYFAQRFYGGYHRRPQFDLDVLVRSRQRRAAARILERLGFTRQAYDLHSRTFVRGRLKVDVHGWLRWAPAYCIDENAVWQAVVPVRLGDLDVLTLSDEFNLVFLALACFEDLGQGMCRLKQLLDVFLFLRQVGASVDWDAFFARRERERLAGVLANMLALVVAVFEAEHDLPRVVAALEARLHLLTGITRDSALDLVFARRKRPANLGWFGRIYPGSLRHYVAWFWFGGFPGNLRELQTAPLGAMLRVVFGTTTMPDTRKSP